MQAKLGWLLVALLATGGCASLRRGTKGLQSVEKLPTAKAQKNPVAFYPDPAQPSRFRGLYFLGESAGRNPEFLTQVENATEETRTLQTVRLELFPERAAVKIFDDAPLEAPEPQVPFTLKNLWQANDGGLWFSDGVAPGIFRYEKGGAIDRRWVPKGSSLGGIERLPQSFRDYFVGPIAGYGGMMFLFGEKPIGKKVAWARVLEWEPELALVKRAFFYPLDGQDSAIAAVAMLDKNRFLVAESRAKGYRLFKVESSAATDIAFNHWMEDPLTTPGYYDGVRAVKTAKKTPLFDLEGEGELDGIALVDYHTVAALRSTEKGAELWLQRLEGNAITSSKPVDNPTVLPEMTRKWRKPSVETL